MSKEIITKKLITLDNSFKKNNPTNGKSAIWRCYFLAQHILINVLGKEWVIEKIHATEVKDNYLRNRADSDEDERRHVERVINLGEYILNLLKTEGFGEKLIDLKKGNIESLLAEFSCAKILFLNQYPFKFVKRSEKKKSDYDFEFIINDDRICCETKCKIEINQLNVTSIMNSLKKANGQLPKDLPGTIMISYPEIIEKNKQLLKVFEESVKRFFGQNNRVISILFHSEVFYFENNSLQGRLFVFKEFVNYQNKFGLYDEIFKGTTYKKNYDSDLSDWINLRKIINSNT